MRYRSVPFVLCLGLLFFGCDSTGNDAPVLQGRYEGTFEFTVEGATFSEAWVLTLQENARGAVSGTGDLGEDMPVTVDGTHDHPDVMLEFTDRVDAYGGRFTGTLSDDGATLDGVYNFTFLFINQPVTLSRPVTFHLR